MCRPAAAVLLGFMVTILMRTLPNILVLFIPIKLMSSMYVKIPLVGKNSL
jgi:hypothetical protein